MISEPAKLADRRKKHFRDFATEPEALDGEKVKIEAIVNQEIEIIGCRIAASKYAKNESGEYLTLQIIMKAKRMVVFTGSDVLIRQIKKYHEQIPFLTTIKRINRYYTLS